MIFALLFVFSLAFGQYVEAALLSQFFPARSTQLEDTSQRLNTAKNTTTHLQTRQDNQKYVFMHHIVGNTYAYTVDDWRNDIQQISSGGVDAVALNFGTDPWQNGQIQNAYKAALGTKAKLFLSFDFSVFPCDVNSVVNVVNQFANDGSQFKINGRPLISSYLGKCLGSTGWQQVKDRTNGYLMPFIAEIEGQFHDWSCLDSWFCWGCAWPQGDADKSVADDQYYVSQLGATKYVATVSPWMFTHYSYKNFYQRGDDWLIASRWEQLIAMRDQVAMIEMITWNDFGESDYFGDIKGDQPSGTTWATGYSHLPFFELSRYYITAYKTGNYPAISEDVIYFWARPHPAQATASADSLSRPSGFDFAEDSLWAVVLATQSAQVTLVCGSSSQHFTVTAGVNKLKIPLSPGKITVSMVRNGQAIINQSPSDFTYSSQPETYNYNAYIGSAKASAAIPVTTVAPPSSSTTSTSQPAPPSSMPTSSTVVSIPPIVPPISSLIPPISSLIPPPSSTKIPVPPVPTPAPQTPWTSYGCVDEGTTGSRRALTGASFVRSDMTPDLCQNLCTGFSFAGVEYGQECYCGNSLTNNAATGAVISSSQCMQPCAGDSSKTCGGAWTLSVYTTARNTPSLPSNPKWRSLGCYTDSASRLLTGAAISRAGMTTEVCITECSVRGYTLAATEFGVECYCGNKMKKNSNDGAGILVNSQECSVPCDGNPTETCGGGWRANVYTSSTLKRHLMKMKRRHT